MTHVGTHHFSASYADAGAGQHVGVVLGPTKGQGAAVSVKEGKGPKVIRGKLNLPTPAKKNGGKPTGK